MTRTAIAPSPAAANSGSPALQATLATTAMHWLASYAMSY